MPVRGYLLDKRTARRWTPEEVAILRDLAERHTSPRVIGLQLQRSADAVRTQAKRQGISFPSRHYLPDSPGSGR